MQVIASLVAVLAVSSAAYVPRIITAPTTKVDYHCSTLMLGRKTGDQIQMPKRTVGSHDYLYVADGCFKQQKKWVGENVTACDSVGSWPPTVLPLGAGSFSPLYINCAQENPHPCYELIIVHVTLYCEPKSLNSL
ncbi:uncharacterized protein LOC134648376 [Cydia amplana]|uniref:uncharacterized protein LOC134648376 n=1 Tax=Cydia amplana TaxID=1869771 RepID=UPI002FE503EA